MAQASFPISQGTIAQRQFSDVNWRDLFGAEPGVTGDMDGSSYAITLSTSSDVASIGSGTQRSTAIVAGFGHLIPAGSPEGITIPVATTSARTDVIALRYDPTFAAPIGPVQLIRIAGTSSVVPPYDASPPGVEDLPLWSVTRQVGQALSQATVKQLFPRIAPSLNIPITGPLPTNSPLGTLARRGGAVYDRAIGSASVPVWNEVFGGSASGRVPITTTGKVANTTALTGVIAVPAGWVTSRVVFTAMGRAGFDDTAQGVAWSWDNIPGDATNVSQDEFDIKVTAGPAQWTSVVTTLSMDMPAGRPGAARLLLRSTAAVYNRGSVIWHRTNLS